MKVINIKGDRFLQIGTIKIPQIEKTDGERTNSERAETVKLPLDVYKQITGVDNASLVVDFLSDLIHWCDANNFHFMTAMTTAVKNYQSEVKEEIDNNHLNYQGICDE